LDHSRRIFTADAVPAPPAAQWRKCLRPVKTIAR
jgi:hypothetical protein